MFLLNGKFEQCLDPSDRGLQYGDGVFETIAVKQGVAQFLDLHLARLSLGCQALLIPPPDPVVLNQEVRSLIADVDCGVLKIVVTRGTGGRGYRLPPTPNPTRLLSLHPYPEYPAHISSNGVVARVCQHRLPDNPPLAGIKHLNRLDQVLARAEWGDDGISEGIMLNRQAEVIEGTMSNVFVVAQGQLLTPSLTHSGVRGIVRDLILQEASAAGIKCHECSFGLERLLDAEEIFVTNSVIGIWPVRQLNDRQWAVGPITQRIQSLWAECCQAEQAKWLEA